MGRRSRAARPTRVSSRSMRIERRLHDRAAVGPRELDGVHGDGGQDPVHVQARAHGLADVAQRLELPDPLGELGAAGLQLLHELDAVDRHRGLTREGGDDRHLPLVEGLDLAAPDVEGTDHLVVEEHRRTHRGAVPADPLEVEPSVVRVRQHVRDLLGPTVEPDPADQGLPADGHRVLGDEPDRLLADPGGGVQPVDAVLEEVQEGRLGAAQPASALDDGAQHRLGIARGTADGRQHPVGGLELLRECGEVPSELLVLLDTDALEAIAHRLPPPSPGAPGAPRRRPFECPQDRCRGQSFAGLTGEAGPSPRAGSRPRGR
jgi:hypothetical protein